MAVAQGYGKTVTSGSVFAYDVADTRNSYIGEPTVNQYTNPDFSNGTTGWTFASWDGNVTYTTEAVTGPFGKTINALKLTKNATSAYSHFHQYNSGKYTTGNQYTLSAWVKGTGTFRGNTQWGGIVQSFTLTGDWQYVQYTVTAPNNDNFPYWAAEALTTGTVFYMVYAQSEQKSHATPFVNSTRSATQGLLPLVGNTSLDLSTVSFDSNAQMTFDGTNDYFSSGYDLSWNNSNSVSIEFIIKRSGTGGGFLGKEYPNWEWSFYLDTAAIQLVYWTTAGGHANGMDHSTSQFMTSTSSYYHVIYAWNGSVSRWYVNSALDTVHTATDPSLNQNRSNNVMVGGHTYVWADSFAAVQLPVLKFYNRALSAGEVRQNYLHYKTRFNLS